MHDIRFEGLETTDRRLRELADDLGYVSLAEVTGRHSCEALGRADFTVTDLAPYLGEADPSELDGLGELGELREIGDLSDPGNEDLARAASRWVRQVAAANMAGRAQAKFKVSLWRPKGDALLHSARFLARNPLHLDGDEGEDFPLIPAPSPTVSAPMPGVMVSPEERVWAALGEGYTRLIALAQGTYSHIAGLQNTAIVSLNGQNQRLQRVVEELSGDLIQIKIGAYEVESGRRTDDGEAKVREELGRQFISELGTLGRVVASAKLGLSPELVELFETVNASPELLDALRSPDVRRLLKDEKTRKELAELLKMAAAAGDPPAAANTPPPPQEEEFSKAA
jgi:hypothetical protein